MKYKFYKVHRTLESDLNTTLIINLFSLYTLSKELSEFFGMTYP